MPALPYPVDVPLDVERSFRFVADEATAEALDEECDEDLLALGREFDLRELIEDELLMALPVVPRHESALRLFPWPRPTTTLGWPSQPVRPLCSAQGRKRT